MEPNDQTISEGAGLLSKLFASPDTFDGRGYNDLLTLFFKGLPLSRLQELLQHENEQVIAGALFIAEELGQRAAPVLGAVVTHVSSPKPRIRYAAFEAISSCTSADDVGAFEHVVLGVRDPDRSCRKRATLSLMRVERRVLQAAFRTIRKSGNAPKIAEGLGTLLDETSADPAAIRDMFSDPDALRRRFALIAAGRMADVSSELLDLAAQSDDPDIREFASAQKAFLAIRQKHRARAAERRKASPNFDWNAKRPRYFIARLDEHSFRPCAEAAYVIQILDADRPASRCAYTGRDSDDVIAFVDFTRSPMPLPVANHGIPLSVIEAVHRLGRFGEYVDESGVFVNPSFMPPRKET